MTPDPHPLLTELKARLVDEGCVGEEEQGCTRDDDNVPLDRWCVNCLSGALLAIVEQQQQDFERAKEMLRYRLKDVHAYCQQHHPAEGGSNVWGLVLDDAIALRQEIDRLRGAQPTQERLRELAIYAFTHHGHDAKLYNSLAELAGMEPWGAQPQE